MQFLSILDFHVPVYVCTHTHTVILSAVLAKFLKTNKLTFRYTDTGCGSWKSTWALASSKGLGWAAKGITALDPYSNPRRKGLFIPIL